MKIHVNQDMLKMKFVERHLVNILKDNLVVQIVTALWWIHHKKFLIEGGVSVVIMPGDFLIVL